MASQSGSRIGARVDRVTPGLVDDLVLGAGLLAAGGTAPLAAADPLRAALTDHGPVPLVTAGSLDPDALVLAVHVLPDAAVGAVLPDAGAARSAVSAAERRHGRRCAAVVALGTGGIGAPVAPYVAAVLGLPCVDADGGLRGSGHLDHTLFALGGLAVAPAWVSDRTGTLVTVETAGERPARDLLRAVASGMAAPAVAVLHPMSARDCARTSAPGALGRCIALGAMARGLRGPAGTDELVAQSVRLLFTGRIAHVARHGRPGALRGTATVETTAPPTRTLRVDFQDSLLVASEDGVVLATAPDLITIVDAVTWTPEPIARLEPGRSVRVLALPAHDGWRTTDGLALTGPRSHGYDIDYEPLEAPSSFPLIARNR
jgi:uncharacterized protein